MRGSRVGRSPPAPPPRAHVSVCTVYIYIFVFIYIHTFTRFRHTPAWRQPQVPPRRVPPVPIRVPARTRLHTCVPACRCTPGPPPHARHRCAPHRCAWTPHSTRTGGAWVPPKAITSPPAARGCRGGTPWPPQAPTKERQPMGAPLWHSPSRAPPSRGGGACCTPQLGRDTLEGGWATTEELWVQFGFFF